MVEKYSLAVTSSSLPRNENQADAPPIAKQVPTKANAPRATIATVDSTAVERL